MLLSAVLDSDFRAQVSIWGASVLECIVEHPTEVILGFLVLFMVAWFICFVLPFELGPDPDEAVK